MTVEATAVISGIPLDDVVRDLRLGTGDTADSTAVLVGPVTADRVARNYWRRLEITADSGSAPNRNVFRDAVPSDLGGCGEAVDASAG